MSTDLNKLFFRAIAGSAISLSTTHSFGQWSDDSTMHQIVADGTGEQVQPKIVSTEDGGCYISWYSSEVGYDVRLQRFDAQGNPMWAHNGILIADRGFSSTQEYDLDIDTNGHAVLVYRDDQSGQVKVNAQRVAPDGTLTWGSSGIEFGNGTDFVASPDIASTSDGSTVIAWINNSDTKLAKISANGMIEWETTVTDPNGQGINLASMHGSDNGSVILSWVQFAQFFDPKHLYAQKIDASGNEAWGSRLPVFDGGSLQFANFPEFTPDDNGGAVFSWYDTANGLNVFAQHVNSDGTERFNHNGIAGSTFPRERVEPAAAYDPETDSVIMSWLELANNQGNRGVYTQRIDSTGARLWSESGVELSPIDANESSSINVQVNNGQTTTLWIENTGGFGQNQVHAHTVDTDGVSVWTQGTIELASDTGDRARLATTSTDKGVIACWQIGPFGDADLESHNINYDGSLGTSMCIADLTGDGNLNFFDISAFLNAFGAMDPIADFTDDGVFNFFDVSAFLNAFNAGCP